MRKQWYGRRITPITDNGHISIIFTKQITSVDLVDHIFQHICHAVTDDDVGFFLEFVEVLNHARVEKLRFIKSRFVDDDVNPLGLEALHDPLDAG